MNGEAAPLLSVIVPVFNEESTVGEVLRRVLAEPTEKEVVVVDDASTDGTAAVLAAVRDPRVRVLRHDRNRGKGAAVRTGARAARGRFAVVQDADLELRPEEFPRLLAPILSGEADAVLGVRTVAPGHRWRPAFRWANRVFSLAASLLAGRRIRDVMTCYKAMPTDRLRAIGPTSNGFEMEPEVVLRLARGGARIVEVSVPYEPRTAARGKKIRFSDSLRVLGAIARQGLP